MNSDFLKSCKYCLAISIGIILGMIIMNIIKDPVIKSSTSEKMKNVVAKNNLINIYH